MVSALHIKKQTASAPPISPPPTSSSMSNKVRSIFSSMALVFLGVQLCQYGMVRIDYESDAQFDSPTVDLEKAQAAAVERMRAIPKADFMPETAEVIQENPPEAINRGETKMVVEDKTALRVYDNAQCVGSAKETVEIADGQNPVSFLPFGEFPLAAKIQGDGLAEVFIRGSQYQGILMQGDECFRFPTDMRDTQQVRFQLYPSSNPIVSPTAAHQIPESLQRQFSTASDLSQPHTRIVFSVQSSHYFGYQVLANAYAFLHSNQTNASWMRLLTCTTPDDLARRFPTFAAPRCLSSRFYNPINKADVIVKWMASSDAPHPQDTIVVVDPDSWLLKDLHPWVKDVSVGHAVGQRAYYAGNPIVQELWKDICLENCHVKMDEVGVPYLLKASDLQAVAPLWKKYSLILKQKLKQDSFQKKYGHMGFDWAAEMIGYNAACTHLKIQTQTVNDLQVRDVESELNNVGWSEQKPSIHVGRAWFPVKNADMAAPWRNKEGMHDKGRIEVWCKCNNTAGEQQPWPIPTEGLDFVSKHTLTLLHDSVQRFGPVPVNESFRWLDNYYKSAQ